MEYTYIPNSIDMDTIRQKYGIDEYIELQRLYRTKVEQLFSEKIPFSELDKRVKSVVDLPEIEDKDYNFYHKFTTLNSQYLYLRNNIHVEKLTDEEIQRLKDSKVDKEFLLETMSKVLFEEGNVAFYGSIVPEVMVPAKSVVFEYAYDMVRLKNLEDLDKAERMENELRGYFQTVFQNAFQLDCSLVTYTRTPDLFLKDDNDLEEDKNSSISI